MKRRGFIKKSSLLGISVGIPSSFALNLNESKINLKKFPIVIATWEVKNATNKAWNLLKNGSSSLDAVEQGCMIEEADVNNQSVGIGGLPDRDGNVTLDACIMNSNGDCGSVVYLKNITHAISVARKIMEETPHVMLAGVGAEEFAYSLGYKKEVLLTDKSRSDWLDWKKKSEYKPVVIKAWEAIAACQQESGKVGWVQNIGANPVPVSSDSWQNFGTGAFLMAGSEILKLNGN